MPKIILKPKVKEQTDPAKMGKDKPPQSDVDTNVYSQPYATTPDGPSGENTQFRGNLQNVSQQTNVAMGSDPAAAKPEGIWQTSITEAAEQIIKERHIITEADYPWDQCVADQTAKYGDEETAKKVCAAIKNRTVSHQNFHEDALPAGGPDTATPSMGPDTASKPPTQPQAQTPSRQECPEGKHWDAAAGDCIDDASSMVESALDEKVRRFKAEDKARNFEEQAALWEQRFRKLDTEHTKLQGKATALEESVKRQEQRADEAIRQLRNQEVTAEEWHKKWEREVALREEYKQQVETHQEENKRLSEKYHKALATNLKLSQDVTKANEDYLEVMQDKERLQEAFDKRGIGAKKILKIKAS